jgi:quercetin dioxygenase-like cupin family protein
MSDENDPRFVAADSGPSFWGPGDRYTFLVTGAQSEGAYFILEAFVPPGGGPPPHIHRREHESFYLLEGTVCLTVGGQSIRASKGDFVHIPRGTVHTFRNEGETVARMLVVFSPAGMEKYMEEVFEPVRDRSAAPPPVTEALIARMVAAADKHGVEFR